MSFLFNPDFHNKFTDKCTIGDYARDFGLHKYHHDEVSESSESNDEDYGELSFYENTNEEALGKTAEEQAEEKRIAEEQTAAETKIFEDLVQIEEGYMEYDNKEAEGKKTVEFEMGGNIQTLDKETKIITHIEPKKKCCTFILTISILVCVYWIGIFFK